MICHYCGLPVGDEAKIEAKTKNAWAHFTCWYEQAPFERELRERSARSSEGTPRPRHLSIAPDSLPDN